MKISEIIDIIKKNCQGYGSIDDERSRDHVLYGDTDRECTGIVTTIYASVDVIRRAKELGANFIISHEACFWNHGDHTDWLQDNETFQNKKALLDYCGITVWRDHDYIHSGIWLDGRYVDGIFYGLAEELNWNQYAFGDKDVPMMFEIPKTPVRDVAQYIMEKLNLKGMKTMGDLDGYSQRIMIPMHIIGMKDNEILQKTEDLRIDTLLCMEITDFTVAIYMRDGAQLGLGKAVLVPGHFNLEEPGMKWFAEKYLPKLFPDLDIRFLAAGDSYTMLLRK